MTQNPAIEQIQNLIESFDGEIGDLRAEILRLIQQEQRTKDSSSIDAIRKKIQDKR